MLNSKPITIAYPFKSSDLNDEELGVSVYSMLRFFNGSLDFLIVGDEPKCDLPGWARHIPHKCDPDPLVDAVKKIEAINAAVGDGRYIYCHDDMFALAPFSVKDLETVLYTWYRVYSDWKPHNRWAQAKKYSMRVLGADEIYDTATHRPRLFEVEKARETLELGRSKPGLWDFQIAYDEMHTPPSRLKQVQEDGKFARIAEPPESLGEIEHACAGKIFLNTTSKGYNNLVKTFVQKAISAPQTAIKTEKPFAEKLPIYAKCANRGADTGEVVLCGSCRALTSEQPIYACSIHGHATLRKPKKRHPKIATKDCVTCFATQSGFEKKKEESNATA